MMVIQCSVCFAQMRNSLAIDFSILVDLVSITETVFCWVNVHRKEFFAALFISGSLLLLKNLV